MSKSSRLKRKTKASLRGWLYVPDGAKNAPAVILCHGFNGTHRNMDSYAEYLAQRGYVCYTFDFCGGGHAEPKLRCNDGHDPADRTR